MKAYWTGLIVGAFVLVSPWLFGFSEIVLARWCEMICGVVLVLVNLWSLYGVPPGASPAPAAASPEPAVAVKVKGRSRSGSSKQK